MEDLIYITTINDKKSRLLSYTAEELESLIDDLNLSMVGMTNEDLMPFIKAISLLTEIKMQAKVIHKK